MRWLFALLLLVAPTARAQEAAAPAQPQVQPQPQLQPQPQPSPEPTPDEVLAIGRDAPGRMTVPVKIGAQGPWPFTIDTGAERTVISRELASLLALPPGPRVRLTAMAGTSEVDTVRIPEITMSSVSGTRIEAPALEGRHLGAPGLLGLDTLKGHAVSIDFERGEMSVRRARKNWRSFAREPGEVVVSAKSLLGQLIVTDASYRGQRVRVVIDTGSALSMGNSALRARALKGRERLNPVTVTAVTGATLIADYTQIGEVRFGSLTFQNLPVAFADAAPFKRLGLEDKPALLLGMDALKLFRRVDIDFPNREVRLLLPR
ncbi:MAG: hypothetical protein A4S12_03770 [Proteobacteria bacterium SG_bin5]|nr:aspartyl protease family protein [Sphingomonas sp.]OQW43982.1 MAG: hypothetical protein A4S12_03770 [Proteobacteria bacterium SG_bin5]